MPSQPHEAVQTVHATATAVLSHTAATSTGSYWRRLFQKPHERLFFDEVRAFVAALDHLLDVPPTRMSRGDLTSIGEDVERVVQRIEKAADEPAQAGAEAAAAHAVYTIRTRYEELYARGATKAD